MKNWNQDPRELLPMHLKLRRGLQFSSAADQIEASMPAVLEPTVITQWQYRLMLSLDGESPLIDVVRDVKSKLPHHFEAGDVWKFLDWMLGYKLISENSSSHHSYDEEVFVEEGVLPESIATMPTVMNPWVRIPLQLIAVLAMCLGVGFMTYLSTPILMAFVQGDPDPTLIVEAEDYAEIIESSRMLELSTATATEIELGADAAGESINSIMEPQAIIEPIVEGPQEPSLVENLMAMRQELVACQIRRDECYLLNDEKGYRKEVARISELAREIGEISAALDQQ